MTLSRCALVALVMLWGCGAPAGPEHDAGEGNADTDATPAIAREAVAPFTQYVDPFIGTGGQGFSVGSAYPGPQRPFGLARPGPDTRNQFGAASFYHCSGYYADDEWITGFSHLRLHGAGIVDYGVVSLMPTNGAGTDKARRDGATQKKIASSEHARPGYYEVTLEDGTRVELTATRRGAAHRWTFAEGAEPAALIDLSHAIARGESGGVDIEDASIEINAAQNELSGFVHFKGAYSRRFGGMRAYFVVRFDTPFSSHTIFDAGALSSDVITESGDDIGALVGFDTSDANTDLVVEARVGVSFTDVEGARANLNAELTDHTFDALVAEAEAEWERKLAVAEVRGTSADDFTLFYSALYHTLLSPSTADDVDGRYRGFDGEVHEGLNHPYFTDFSLWDTFRTTHPLQLSLFPDDQADFLRSLVQMARDGGYIDRWPLGIGYTGGMVGESATLLFADAIVKQLNNIEYDEAYASLRSTAVAATPEGARYSGRPGLHDYLALGYVASDHREGSASITLEYAYNDWALARIAEQLNLTSDQTLFDSRARNWRNLWDPSTGYLRGRSSSGAFADNFDVHAWTSDFVEGNASQYQWYAPHDLVGLAEAMGGQTALLERLTTFFEDSERARHIPLLPDADYWQGNEPDIHAAWIFSAFDEAATTTEWVRWIARNRYGLGTDGLPGNDDAGTMSAWLAFAMMGLYPLPGEDTYLLSTPAFERITLHLPSADVVIEGPGWPADGRVATQFTFETSTLGAPRIAHTRLIQGGLLTAITSANRRIDVR